MGFFNKLFGKNDSNSSSSSKGQAFEGRPGCILAPLSGRAYPINEIPDQIFAGGTLGQGLGIDSDGDTVYAPFDGTITYLAETLHAVGMSSDDGADILVHVGIDTVDMNGRGFKALVKADQTVKAGTPILKFDTAAIRTAGHPTATAVIVTNCDDLAELKPLAAGIVKEGAEFIKYSVK